MPFHIYHFIYLVQRNSHLTLHIQRLVFIKIGIAIIANENATSADGLLSFHAEWAHQLSWTLPMKPGHFVT